MEKKKLLLVAVSVGVVLLIIIGIPLIMIAPRQNHALTRQSVLSGDEDRGWGVAVEPSTYKAETPPDVVVEPLAYTGSTQPHENIVSKPVPHENIVSKPVPVETPRVTTITVPMPQTAAVPDTPAAQAQKPSSVKLVPASSPPAAKPAANAKPAAASAPAPKAAAKPSAASAKPAGKTYNTYWVQTGAFSTNVRAEASRELLASKGITSIIDSSDVNGKTWYRVRVGPYMSETEANYWLALVKSMDGFSESQIRLSQASR